LRLRLETSRERKGRSKTERRHAAIGIAANPIERSRATGELSGRNADVVESTEDLEKQRASRPTRREVKPELTARDTDASADLEKP
jgi:hypothetical protein